jgi:hypothetical protein
MLRLMQVTALVTSFAGIAIAASPSIPQDGTVTSVDRGNKIFTVQSKSGISTYRATDHTVFRVGITPTNWSAVKAASKVGIVFHLEDNKPVADEVVISD